MSIKFDNEKVSEFLGIVKDRAMRRANGKPDTMQLERIFRPHTAALKFLKVEEVGWFGCHRRSLGKPFWTWHEMWAMANGYIDPGDTREDFVGLKNAIETFCIKKDAELEPPTETMSSCEFKFSI